jgi:hypothetical protein
MVSQALVDTGQVEVYAAQVGVMVFFFNLLAFSQIHQRLIKSSQGGRG